MPDDNQPDPDKGGGGDKTFTQADLDRVIDRRLGEERRKYSDYDDLKAKAARLDEAEAATKSEVDKLKDQVADLTSKLATSDQRSERLDIALAKGLNAAQAKRLVGSTKEELEKDADEILETFSPGTSTESTETKGGPPSNRPKPDLKGGTDPTEDPTTETNPAKLVEGLGRY